MRRRASVATAALLLLLGGVLLGSPQQDRAGSAEREGSRVARVAADAAPVARDPLGARLLRRTQLRAHAGGRVVRTLGTKTNFGSPRVLAVVGRRGDWLAVLSPDLPNSRAGWIPAASARLLHEPITLHVDRSARSLVLRREGRVVRRMRVAVGGPGTATPTGRFAVTDALRFANGGPYGCCALALTGHQRNVPQGWTGGDRLAIHGTSNEATIGTAASAGCLRARETDMRWLLARVPLGAPVRIRA